MTPQKKQDTPNREKTPQRAEEQQEHQEDGQQGQGEGDGRDGIRKFCPVIFNRRSFLEMLRIFSIGHIIRTGIYIHASRSGTHFSWFHLQ